MPVHRRRNAKGAALGDRLAKEVEKRIVDARVRDAGGREKKLHAASPGSVATDPSAGRDGRRPRAHRIARSYVRPLGSGLPATEVKRDERQPEVARRAPGGDRAA